MGYSDNQIKTDVTDQLRLDERVDASGIQVQVRKGTVILSGTVPTYMARETARADAWMIPGVRAVQNNLRVSASRYLPAGELVALNVRSILSWSTDLHGSDIRVSIREESILLEGTVDADWKKRRAEELAGFVVGVAGVINHIAVKTGKP